MNSRAIRERVAVCLCALGFLVPPLAAAQPRVSYEVAAGFTPAPREDSRPVFALAPVGALDGASVHAALEGVLVPAGPSRLRAARLTVSKLLAPDHLLHPEVLVRSAGSWIGSRTGIARPEVRLHFAGARAGTWVAGAAEGSMDRADGYSGRGAFMGFGAWTRHRRLTISGALEQSSGILPRPTSAPAEPDTGRYGPALDGPMELISTGPERVTLTHAHGRLSWEGDRWELETGGGLSLSPLASPRRWAQASLAWRLSPLFSVVAVAGSRSPQLFAIDPAGERKFSIALRAADSRSREPGLALVARATVQACKIRSLGGGRYLLSVHAPGARLAEVQGDFTGWASVTLDPAGGGWWETLVDASPGVHHLGLRVDGGAWVPPPSFPTAEDDFNGTVGVVVLE